MKRFIIFLVTILSFHFAHGQSKVDTVEAHRLFEEGRRLLYSYKFNESLIKFQKSAKEFKEQKQELRYAKSLLYQLYCYNYLDVYNHNILLIAERALYLFHKYNSIFDMANLYSTIGDYYEKLNIDTDKALHYYYKSLELYEKNGIRSSLQLAWLWNSIGKVYMVQKYYRRAIVCYKKSHQILQKLLPENDVRLSYYFAFMAACYMKQNRYEKSIKYLKEDIKRSKGVREGNYATIGKLYLYQKKKQLSEKYYQKALMIAKKRYPNLHQNIGYIYGSMSEVYMLKQNYLMALNLTQKGMKYAVNNFNDTLNIYSHSSTKNSKHLDTHLHLLSHKAKAFSLLSNNLKDLRASLYNYQLYDSIRVKAKINSFRSNDYFVQKAYTNAIQVCQRLYHKTQDKKYQHLAFYFAQRSHANTLTKSLQARRAKLMAHLPDSLIYREMYLKQQRAHYQQKILAVKDSLQKKAYQDSIFRMVRAQDQLNEVYARKFPKYYQLRYQSKPITVSELQDKLNNEAIVLSYVWGEEQSHVLAITHNDLNMYTLPPQAKVTTALNAYYDALQQEQRLKNFVKKSHQAYQYLLAPVAHLLQNKSQIIVANPTLLSVPLEALVTQPYQTSWQRFEQLPYLVKKHKLSYHYSTTLWWQSQNAAMPTTKKSLSFAAFAPFSGGKGKVMATRANEGLLPESKVEVSTVYNFFQQKNHEAVAYLSSAATRQKFLNQVPKSDILHIASHSTANLRETRLAKIHFAPQAHADSSYLYAESIYYLPLKAQLVVLSSCDSGVGKFELGEGVMSLARAFLHAGAKSVISSLWEADDVYTKKLMILFYNKALFKQETYAEALSHAKRQLMKQEPSLHPKYWSSFVLIGN